MENEMQKAEDAASQNCEASKITPGPGSEKRVDTAGASPASTAAVASAEGAAAGGSPAEKPAKERAQHFSPEEYKKKCDDKSWTLEDIPRLNATIQFINAQAMAIQRGNQDLSGKLNLLRDLLATQCQGKYGPVRFPKSALEALPRVVELNINETDTQIEVSLKPQAGGLILPPGVR